MHFITGKHIERRTFIRGMGASVALPFLDAMVPAGRLGDSGRASLAADKMPLICIEEVHGLAGCNDWGATQYLYAPETVGRDFELIADHPAKSLEAYRDYLTLISNTDVRMAEPLSAPEVGGDHFRSSAVFLTQSHPKQTQGSDLWVGTPSLDQIYAKRFGQDTPLPSMQFCIENLDQSGGCTYNYSCAYTDTISWSSPSEPMPMIRDPRVAFDMLFGAGSSPEERAERRAERASILDWIADEVASFKRDLGAVDRQRMDKYLDNVREIERRIEMIEKGNSSGEERALPEAPPGVPDTFKEHMEMMFDLQVLALETEMTRVISFKTGRDAQNRVFPDSDSARPFHPASHHGGREEAILEFNVINKYRLGTMAYFLEKMQNSVVGDSNLLEKSLILWGSPMADANIHNHRRCPLILMGHANGQLAGNVHLQAADDTPMANVMLTLLHMLGHEEIESFGDSDGAFSLATPPVAATSF